MGVLGEHFITFFRRGKECALPFHIRFCILGVIMLWGFGWIALRMRAYTYEASLLKLQFDLKKGVFACPGYDVYSNQDTEGGPQ